MKILKYGKVKFAPRKRILRCKCKSIFLASDIESFKAESVLGIPNRYVTCPCCGDSVFYSDSLKLREQFITYNPTNRVTLKKPSEQEEKSEIS